MLFYTLTSAGPLSRCWNPRVSSSGFNISLGAQQMLMHRKSCLIPILYNGIIDHEELVQHSISFVFKCKMGIPHIQPLSRMTRMFRTFLTNRQNIKDSLAHLSRRLTRWAYSIPVVHRLSVVVHTFKLECLWSQLANLDQILCVASLGWGKGCIRFWNRLDQNSGFHGNRNLPLTYNGENDVSTFSQLFLIRSFLNLQVKRTCIKSRTSSNFGQIGPLTMELAALERLKNFP